MVIVNFSINYLAVLMAAVASFLFGWLWYGPLFGKLWSKELKIKEETKPNAKKLLLHFLLNIVMVFFFATILSGTLLEMILLAAVIWAGFMLSTKLTSMVWMKQSWNLFSIDMVYHLLNLCLIVVVLSLF